MKSAPEAFCVLLIPIKPGSKHLGIHDAIDEAGRCVPCIEQPVRIGCQGSVALFFVSRLLGAFFVLTARPGTVNRLFTFRSA